MKNLLPFLFGIVLLSSCKKECHRHHTPPDVCAEPQITIGDCITDSNQIKSLLYGKWMWAQTWANWRWTENRENPCTNNRYYTYEFLPTGKLNVYLSTSSDTVVCNYTFMQTYTSEIYISSATTDSLDSEIYNHHGAVRICGNYLVIDNSPVDGAKVTFLRQN